MRAVLKPRGVPAWFWSLNFYPPAVRITVSAADFELWKFEHTVESFFPPEYVFFVIRCLQMTVCGTY